MSSCVVRGVWCGCALGMWCVVCGVRCAACGVWCVVCGVVCGVWDSASAPPVRSGPVYINAAGRGRERPPFGEAAAGQIPDIRSLRAVLLRDRLAPPAHHRALVVLVERPPAARLADQPLSGPAHHKVGHRELVRAFGRPQARLRDRHPPPNGEDES